MIKKRLQKNVKIKWTIRCSYGRRLIIQSGQARRCVCGHIYRC